MTARNYYEKYDEYVEEMCGRDAKKEIRQWAKDRVSEARSMGMPLPSPRPITMETQSEMEALSIAYPSLFKDILESGRHVKIPHAIYDNIDIALARQTAAIHARARGEALPIGIVADNRNEIGIIPTENQFRDIADHQHGWNVEHHGGRTFIRNPQGTAIGISAEDRREYTALHHQNQGRNRQGGGIRGGPGPMSNEEHERYATLQQQLNEGGHLHPTTFDILPIRPPNPNPHPFVSTLRSQYFGNNDPAEEAHLVREYTSAHYSDIADHQRHESHSDRPIENSSLRVERQNDPRDEL